MATTEATLPSTRTRPAPSNAILSKPSGLFIGLILTFIGGLWMAHVLGYLDLGPKFGELVGPTLLLFAGLYLVIVKAVRG